MTKGTQARRKKKKIRLSVTVIAMTWSHPHFGNTISLVHFKEN